MAMRYVAYNREGERVTGVLPVESRARAEEILWGSGHIIVKLRKIGRRPSLAQLMPTLFGVKPLQVITFTRELASLLYSGIPLLQSLRILYQEEEGAAALREALRSVMRDVEEGNPFSLACSRQPAVFSSFYTRLVQVAEEAGELKKILLEIADYMEKQRETQAKIMKALTYPAIVLVMGLGAAGVFVFYALPSMAGLLQEYGAQLPFVSQLLFGAGNFARSYILHAFGVLIVAGLLGWWYLRTPSGKKRWDATLLKMPRVGRIVEHSQMARLCSTISTLLSSGIPLVETIYLARGTTDNTVIREGLSGVYQEVSGGARLEPAIVRQKVFPRLFSQTVGISEETGSLQANLPGLATYYEQETDRAVASATALIEPIVIVTVGVVVAIVAMGVVSGMYSILPQIK